MTNREELAWAGGFFSGEGYTGFNKSSYTYKKKNKPSKPRNRVKIYPTMNIAQVGSAETLDRFNNAIGNIGKVYGPYGPYKANKQAYYQFQLSGFENTQAAVAMLWPFLSTVKQEQATNVLNKYLEQEKLFENPTFGYRNQSA